MKTHEGKGQNDLEKSKRTTSVFSKASAKRGRIKEEKEGGGLKERESKKKLIKSGQKGFPSKSRNLVIYFRLV